MNSFINYINPDLTDTNEFTTCTLEYLVDSDDSIIPVYISPQIKLISGQDSEFHNDPKNYFKIIHPSDIELITNKIHISKSIKQKARIIEYRIINKDNSIHWVRENLTVIHSNNGIRFTGTLFDITEERIKNTENYDFSEYFRINNHNVKESEITDPFDSFFKNQSAAMLMISTTTGNLIKGNNAALESLGYTSAELYSLNVSDIFRIGPFGKHTHRNSSLCSIILAGGKRKIFEVDNSYINYYGQNLLCLILHEYVHPIENRFSKREKFLDYFADNTEEMFWVSDSKGLVYFNEAFLLLSGLSRMDLQSSSQNILNLIHPDDKFKFLKNIYSSGIQNEVLNFHFRIIKENYNIHWIYCRLFPISGSDSVDFRRGGIARDVTRIFDLEAQLQDSRDKALESDKLKTAFLNNLNHEIRTPMNGIIGFSEILQLPGITEEKKTYYTGIIIEQSKKLLGIINDIVRASKNETYEIGFNKKMFCLNSVLKEVFNRFARQYENENLKFILQLGLDDSESMIYSGKDQLIQILNYLLSNSVKFTTKGHIILNYKLSNSKVLVELEDTGIGIDKKHHESVFAMFRQVELSLDKSHGGNGLGLSIAQKLVKYLEGEIWLNSELNKGTHVYFTIPYIRDY